MQKWKCEQGTFIAFWISRFWCLETYVAPFSSSLLVNFVILLFRAWHSIFGIGRLKISKKKHGISYQSRVLQGPYRCVQSDYLINRILYMISDNHRAGQPTTPRYCSTQTEGIHSLSLGPFCHCCIHCLIAR